MQIEHSECLGDTKYDFYTELPNINTKDNHAVKQFKSYHRYGKTISFIKMQSQTLYVLARPLTSNVTQERSFIIKGSFKEPEDYSLEPFTIPHESKLTYDLIRSRNKLTIKLSWGPILYTNSESIQSYLEHSEYIVILTTEKATNLDS